MKNFFTVLFILAIYSLSLSAQTSFTYAVSAKDIYSGYIVKKVWLTSYEMPQISISKTAYVNASLPEDAIPSSPENFDILLGKERKRPFALVRIPAFNSGDGKTVKRIASITLNISENQPFAAAKGLAKTTASNSPLASGNWYKVSVPATGLYKVDYAFASSKFGIGNVPSANIRVFGSGGNMLPEDNSVTRGEGLQENAIWVMDGGDGVFGPGDYFIFYGSGPINWKYKAETKRFVHEKNLYEDKGYYFINFDQGAGKRISSMPSADLPNVTVTSFSDYAVHEKDLVNPGKFGKNWYGEEFATTPGKQNTRTIDMDLGPTDGNTMFRIQLASRSAAEGSTFTITMNGQPVGSYSLSAAARNDDDRPVSIKEVFWEQYYNSNKASFNFTYTPSLSNGIGYLDFIEINTRRQLAFTSESLLFREPSVVGSGNIANYIINNANSNTQVWDVSDPHNPTRIDGALSGNTYTFSRDAEYLHQFAAFNGSNLNAPEFVEKVENQNLQGSTPVDYIIVSHPYFYPSAERLAQFHRNRGMRVIVTTTKQVYNEFSSGGQDVSAIRDFARMFYDRAGNDTNQMPRYLLLFGDASYDYKDRVPNNTNMVPTFESAESFNVISSFCNDDFFGFLDDNENIENTRIANTLDIGVGRLPVKNATEAENVVNKIYTYKSAASLGPWRLSTTLIADDEDPAGPHLQDGEIMDTVIQKNSNIYNSTKIYEDIMEPVSTPGGARLPEANKAINDQVYKGTFLLNYNGHGNTQVLSHERILTEDDYNKWKNIDKLPFMVTATCDYGRFDHPDYVSSGEQLVLKADGGVIAGLTTTQLVYQYANRTINREFLDAQFRLVRDKWNKFGDAFRIAKNHTYSDANTTEDVLINFRKFALLGDPALEPNFPEHYIATNEILDGATGQKVDSISALGEYIVKGSVVDANGNKLDNFNGRLSVVFYDKARTVNTQTFYGNRTFNVRNNIIYRGKATVTNGDFSFAFITPKDINYEYGKGKLSLYAENGSTDGAGFNNNYTIGGYSDNPRTESRPPIVKPYIGDTLFKNGGITGSNTLLYVILEDETGINVSGNSVGHDLIAILDGDVSNPYIMNDYYETEANTYKRGYVKFPITNLPEGRHRLTVKAWDVNNNSGEGHVDFVVVNGGIVKIQNLMNYPNPFSDKTHFVFEHNHPDELLTAEIEIYNTSGERVASLKQNFEPNNSRSNEISWDGTNDRGAKLPAGVYIYKFKIATEKGIETIAHQKLVIVR
jgi:hypothetical protein